MIEVRGLVKRYGRLAAVDGVDLTAGAGSVFGLLGPNGAGKSTTIGCISGLVEPSGGSVRVLGHDVAAGDPEARRHLGVVPQELALYEDLSARENLHYWGAAYGVHGRALRERAQEVLASVGLAERADERVARMSGGMQRRLNFACGIVHRPRVLLLDEPTAGVDPQSRVKILELVRTEARRGACVLYTTHYMEEAEELCDRVGIMDRGRIIALGTLAELRAMTGDRDLLRLVGSFDPEKVSRALRELAGPSDDLELVHAESGQLTLGLPDATRRLPAVLSALAATGAEIRETVLTRPSLESLFIGLTGKELRD